MNAQNRDCCHQLLKKIKILPLKLQHIFSPFIIHSQK